MTDAANDKEAVACRSRLARFSADQFVKAGTELHLIGHLIGPDRAQGRSPFGHGNDETIAVSMQLLLSDLLGHVGRIWDHLCGWARQNENGGPILKLSRDMSARFQEWKSKDRLVDLPSP